MRSHLSKLLHPESTQVQFHKEFRKYAANPFGFLTKECVDATKTRIWLICMPKSGSTFLTAVLKHYTGYPTYELPVYYGHNEQEVSWPKLSLSADTDAIYVHQHTRCSSLSLETINLFSIKPIISVRNICDIVVSVRDHLLKESTEGPLAFVPAEFAGFSPEQQMDFVISMALPWYFNFYTSWLESCRLQKCRAHWVRYEDLIESTASTLRKLLEFCGLRVEEDRLLLSIEQAGRSFTRKNVGIAGRGRSMLNDSQKEAIRRMAAFYPSVDFAPLGLP